MESKVRHIPLIASYFSAYIARLTDFNLRVVIEQLLGHHGRQPVHQQLDQPIHAFLENVSYKAISDIC